MAENVTTTSRRGILGAIAAGAAAAAILPSVAFADPISLARRIADHDAWTRRLNGRAEESEWEQWTAAGDDLFTEVEALPNTRENMQIRARAIMSICEGDVNEAVQGDTTVERLMRDILKALWGLN